MNPLNVIRRLAVRYGYANDPRLSAPVSKKKTVWSIGIYFGNSLAEFQAPEDIANPVLTRADVTDVTASFVADPFMIQADDNWNMFFEVYNRENLRGEIGLATSTDGVHWSYRQIVLREPFHLSYPYVFNWEDSYYLIPESRAANSIRLYHASHFPDNWDFVATLLTGPYADASVFRHEGKWWLFADSKEGTLTNDTLRLFSSDALTGPWQEHPQSPIIAENPHIARPGGRVLVDEKPVRYTQDCYPIYGTQLRAFTITRLSPVEYEECPLSPIPVLTPSGSGWNQSGMHHIDPHRLPDGRWMACVDGFWWEDVSGSSSESKNPMIKEAV